MILRELEIGDRFIHASARNKRSAHKWRVKEDCKFNSGHGTSTRKCVNLNKNTYESKSCNLEIIKLPIA